jgi:hypothetical protein
VAAAVAALTKPRRVTRRIILQKARRQGGLRPTPPTAWTHTVSGSISLPSPGCFSPFPHGTVRYRSRRVGSLGRWAAQLHTGLHVSGTTQVPTGREDQCLLRGYHPLWRRVPHGFAYWVSVTWRAAARRGRSYNPVVARPAGLARRRFGLSPVRSPLLRGYFLFLGVREMVQFPRFPHLKQVSRPKPWGCPIRRSWDHGLRATPPRLSQLCHVLHRHDAPRHPPCAHTVFPAHRRGRDACCRSTGVITTAGEGRMEHVCVVHATRCTWKGTSVTATRSDVPRSGVPEVPSPLNRA